MYEEKTTQFLHSNFEENPFGPPRRFLEKNQTARNSRNLLVHTSLRIAEKQNYRIAFKKVLANDIEN